MAIPAFSNSFNQSIPFTAWPWMVGFERQIDTLAKMSESMGRGNSYPPYNIVKYEDNKYGIEVAVAGFNKDEITVEVDQDQLMIKGKKSTTTETVEFLHRGLAARDFEQTFTLAEYMEVKGATVADGMLKIEIERIVPEALKPRLITIK